MQLALSTSSECCQFQLAPARQLHSHCRPSQQHHRLICRAFPTASSKIDSLKSSKRQILFGAALLATATVPGWHPAPSAQASSLDDDFTTTPSGLKLLDVRAGEGVTPRPGDTVVVHWSGYTKGYQGKRIDNTSVRDEPYEFVLGQGQAIKAFEDAVSTMQVGGIRRVEVPGDQPQLSYPRDRSQRFTNELISADGKIYKYRYGPQPVELGGQRALDFVLDNSTLQDFNRTLLFDIKLLSVRKPR